MLAIAVAAVLAVTTPEGAGQACSRNVITVEGQAEIRVKPDLARIAFLIEQRSGTLPEAEAAARASADGLIAAAHERGVADSDIDSSDYSVWPMYERTDGKKLGRRLGFQVRRTVRVTLRDVSKLGSLWLARPATVTCRSRVWSLTLSRRAVIVTRQGGWRFGPPERRPSRSFRNWVRGWGQPS